MPWLLPVLVSGVLLLFESRLYPVSAGGSHSLRYFYTGVSGTPPELVLEYVAVGYVDDEQVTYYDSAKQLFVHRAQWMKDNEGPQLKHIHTQRHISWQKLFKQNMKIVIEQANQTAGIRAVQVIYGCQVHDDGAIDGFYQFGFDGQTFITFDKETETWTAATQPAEIIKKRWNADRAENMNLKRYLEESCIEWLKKYVQYGQSSLERKVRPEVQVTDRRSSDDSVTLVCDVTGFYPRDIDVYFVKNGKVQMEMAGTSGIIPNNDGTYQIKTWIETGPQDESSYACHVEHDSVKPKLTVMWEHKSDSNILIIVGIIAAVVILIGVIVGVVIWKKKQAGGKNYTPANKNDQGESSSNSSAQA